MKKLEYEAFKCMSFNILIVELIKRPFHKIEILKP